MEKSNYNGALQQPISSGFSAETTADEVISGINLAGKIAVVTGGSTGVGLETVKTLSKAGATVIVLARDVNKAKENLQGIANVEIEEVDLISANSIDTFTDKFLASGKPLHLLINNAGIMFVPLRRDANGNESQLATNYLAAFRLTARLWPALLKANSARVINVSSLGHHFAPFSFDDPNFKDRGYDTFQAYGQSKTALNLFSMELDYRAKSSSIRAYSLHPGNIWGTELIREAPLETLQQFGFVDEKGNAVKEVIDSLKTISQGAATTIWAATSPLLNQIGGVYLEDVNIAELAVDSSMSHGIKPYSVNKDNAKQLWTITEGLTGITFNAG